MISSMSFVFKIVTFYDKGVFLDRTMGDVEFFVAPCPKRGMRYDCRT